MTRDEINKAITNREIHSGNDEWTYYNQHLYDFACDNYDDPHLLFKIAIYGYYQPKYGWTKQQADFFIDKHKEDSVKWSDGEVEYYYDWGKGKNKITNHDLHWPNLDHIIPKSLGGTNDPENMRIRCCRLNGNRGNNNSDHEIRATIVDMFSDLSSVESKQNLINYLITIVKTSNDS